MRQGERDSAYLWDMLDAARTIREFTSGVEFEQYNQNRMLQLAVERALEIIGEAARRVSDTFKQDHPKIPWRSIIAQRNVLAHEYGEIQQGRIWVTAKVHVAELIGNLEPLIPPPPPELKESW